MDNEFVPNPVLQIYRRLLERQDTHLAAEVALERELLFIVVRQQGDTEYVQNLKEDIQETREIRQPLNMVLSAVRRLKSDRLRDLGLDRSASYLG